MEAKRSLTTEEISSIVDGFDPIDWVQMELLAKLPPGKRIYPSLPDINVDADLSPLAGQSVDFVLDLRPENGSSAQDDGGLWIAPVIYRLNP